MANHSPGPWDAEDICVRARPEGVLVCGAYSSPTRGPDVQAANARLIAAAPELLAACDDAARWLGGESDLEHYETIAEWFHADTGMMRPGKDMPAGLDDAQDRHAAFCEWAEAKRHKINADLRAAIAKARGQ